MNYYFQHEETDPGFHEPLPGDEVEARNDMEDRTDTNINSGSSSSSSSSSSVGGGGGGKRSGKRSRERRLPFELQRLFAQLQNLEQRSVATQDLTTKAFHFSGNDASVQHDVQELITKLLDRLEGELRRTKGSYGDGLVTNLFQCTSRTELKCQLYVPC